MAVRAKFYVRALEFYSSPVGTGVVKMSPVWASKQGVEGNACEENHIFGKYTPSGECWMNIQNPDALKQFVLGKSYYLDFSEAE